MTFFDKETRVFSGEKRLRKFQPEVNLGSALFSTGNPDKVVQINGDDGKKLTCRQLLDMTKKIASNLLAMGLKFGDVVGFCGKNSTYLTPAVFSCLLLGLPISAADTSQSSDEILNIYRRTKPSLVFCDVDQVDKIQDVLKATKSDAKVIVIDGECKRFKSIEDLLSEVVKVEIEIPQSFGVSSDKVCAAIFSTSGSTGLPKLACVSHAQLLHSVDFVKSAEDKVFLNFFSLLWTKGFIPMIFCFLQQSTRLITKQAFSAKHCVKMIEKFRATQVTLLPSEIINILDFLKGNSFDLSSVKIISTAGWSICEDTISSMERKLPNCFVAPIYGMTELSSIVSERPTRDPVSSSAGKLGRNNQVKILMDDGTLGCIGDVGEILIKQPFNIISYLNDDKETKAFIDNESYVHSGDIGYFDEHLNLYISGRKKFIIRSLHHQVHPSELENAIIKVHGIINVCVVAIPSLVLGFVPCAIVVKSKTSLLTEQDIFKSVENSFSESYKQLHGVFFVDTLPLTRTGKLNRFEAEKIAIKLAKLA